MAANYWASTQRQHWQFTRQQLLDIRTRVEDDRGLVLQFPLPERRLLSIYFRDQIIRLGRKLGMRQQAVATAQVYVRRFYTKVELRRTNPYLVLATAVYLAGKMEECPQHIRLVVSEARNLWPDLITADTAKLGECEFYLISEMNSQLIVHHPYRTLLELQTTLSLTQDETAVAWYVINDHYLTDLPLLHPPHVVAVTSVFLALSLRPSHSTFQPAAAVGTGPSAAAAASTLSSPSLGGPAATSASTTASSASNGTPQNKVQKLVKYLAESEVDMDNVIECTQQTMALYEVWEQYNDKVCKEQIARFVKARGLDK
ncbi:MAG: hypothetical protein M1817_005454 [Caeruleum heppii]|nr:MAG: hypothetical protein M1817_005454 [Caeruleum heppii]